MRRRRIRVLAVVVGAAVLFGAAAVAPPQDVDASFTDSETAKASVTAGTLTAPSNMTCTVTNAAPLFLTFQSVTITWKSDYPLSSAGPITVLIASSPAKTSQVTSGITPSGGGPFSYSVTLTQGVLESLVTNLLGSTTTFTVKNTAGTLWTSSMSTKTLTMTLAGLFASCS